VRIFKEATRRLASILCNIMEKSIGWNSQGKGAVGFYFCSTQGRQCVLLRVLKKEKRRKWYLVQVCQWNNGSKFYIKCKSLRVVTPAKEELELESLDYFGGNNKSKESIDDC